MSFEIFKLRTSKMRKTFGDSMNDYFYDAISIATEPLS